MQINNTTVEVIKGGVDVQKVDAIVNPADEKMRGGGTLDKVIHDAAGSELKQELERIAPNRVWTGAALITKSYNLSSRGISHIIHTVGPDARCNKYGNEQLLASCYRSCLEVADANALTSIAFCSISTGEFEYPLSKAAPIAVKTVREYLETHPQTPLRRVVFAMWGAEEFQEFTQALEAA